MFAESSKVGLFLKQCAKRLIIIICSYLEQGNQQSCSFVAIISISWCEALIS
jgi:hypothetical protein